VTIIHLAILSLACSSNLPENPREQRGGVKLRCFPIWSCTEWGLPCHTLLPVARCALTAPFQPYLYACAPSAVYSLLHCPSALTAQPLAGILLYSARTFLRDKSPRLSTLLRWRRILAIALEISNPLTHSNTNISPRTNLVGISP